MLLIKDVFIAIFYYLGINNIYQKRLLKRGPLVRLIVFHDVVCFSRFDKTISILNEKYNLITPDDFHQKNFDSKKINLLITFDDGYQSWVDICLPVMEKFNCKALFFINSFLLDISNDQEQVTQYMKNQLKIHPVRPLTWEGARKLISYGHTIGGHTKNHKSLGYLSTKDVYDEIKMDKSIIEKELGLILEDFAYPFGNKQDYNKDTILIAEDIGYKFQYSVSSEFATKSNNNNELIPRTLLRAEHETNKLSHWVTGGYDLFTKIKNALR